MIFRLLILICLLLSTESNAKITPDLVELQVCRDISQGDDLLLIECLDSFYDDEKSVETSDDVVVQSE